MKLRSLMTTPADPLFHLDRPPILKIRPSALEHDYVWLPWRQKRRDPETLPNNETTLYPIVTTGRCPGAITHLSVTKLCNPFYNAGRYYRMYGYTIEIRICKFCKYNFGTTTWSQSFLWVTLQNEIRKNPMDPKSNLQNFLRLSFRWPLF